MSEALYLIIHWTTKEKLTGEFQFYYDPTNPDRSTIGPIDPVWFGKPRPRIYMRKSGQDRILPADLATAISEAANCNILSPRMASPHHNPEKCPVCKGRWPRLSEKDVASLRAA